MIEEQGIWPIPLPGLGNRRKRNHYQRDSARAQKASNLAKNPAVIAHMFKNMDADDQVEGAVTETHCMRICNKARAIEVGDSGSLKVSGYSKQCRVLRQQALNVSFRRKMQSAARGKIQKCRPASANIQMEHAMAIVRAALGALDVWHNPISDIKGSKGIACPATAGTHNLGVFAEPVA